VSFVDAVTLTGLAYPAVFGGVGGILAYFLNAVMGVLVEKVTGTRS